ncbi:hypothetical protein GCM10028801_28690 [Nocardioides maradonensis]
MYGENGAQMRTELAILLRQHRVMHRLGTDSPTERAEVGRQIQRYRQVVLAWCTQAIDAAAPLTFANVPSKPADPFRSTSDHGAAVRELQRALIRAWEAGTTDRATTAEITSTAANDVVEHWRVAARAAALAEHDTAPDQSIHLTAAQARTIAGDVAAITQALVVLDRRYRNNPGWETLPGSDRLGWAALATALDVSLGQPDFSVDQTGWHPRTRPIPGPGKPGVLGVLQAQHNLLVGLKSPPNAMNLRRIVDSQRLLTGRLVPYAEQVDPDLAARWRARASTYDRMLHELRNVGGRLGNGGAAAAEAANAVSRMSSLSAETIIEPRMLGGFQALFQRLDARIADILETGVERGAFVQRVTVPRLVSGDGQLVAPVRERFVPVSRATDLDVIRTTREHLRPRPAPQVVSPGTSRADLASALVHRPRPRPDRGDFPAL